MPALVSLPTGFRKPGTQRGKELGEGRYLEGNSDINSFDAGSSDISSDLKHRANDARDGS
jgi:hypothetical protein